MGSESTRGSREYKSGAAEAIIGGDSRRQRPLCAGGNTRSSSKNGGDGGERLISR